MEPPLFKTCDRQKGQREIILKAKCGRWLSCFSDVRNPRWHRVPCFGAQLEGRDHRCILSLASRVGSARVVWEMPRQSGGEGGEGQSREGTNVCHEEQLHSSSLARPPSLLLSYSGLAQSVSGPCHPLKTLSRTSYGHEVIAHGRLVRNDWVT